MVNRADFIAVDQVQKFNSAVNLSRYESLGVEKYIWRTSKDERVRGNPSGLWPGPNPGNRPRVYGNHFGREGKTYTMSNPPPGGHPGQDYRCRCHMEPIINFNTDLKKVS